RFGIANAPSAEKIDDVPTDANGGHATTDTELALRVILHHVREAHRSRHENCQKTRHRRGGPIETAHNALLSRCRCGITPWRQAAVFPLPRTDPVPPAHAGK